MMHSNRQRSVARMCFSPTGFNNIAQGRAQRRPGLGLAITVDLKGQNNTSMFCPFRATRRWRTLTQGGASRRCRCALPWADMFSPVGAFRAFALLLARTFLLACTLFLGAI
jgi:hypothetical protein